MVTTTTTQEEFPHYVSILEASFDAGILVDGGSSSSIIKKSQGRGRILYANSVAQALFEGSENASMSLVGGSMDEFLSFGWKSNKEGDSTTEASVPWNTVVRYATQTDDPVREWTVRGKLGDKTFPGILRLVQLDGTTNPSGNSSSSNFWLVFVRHADPANSPCQNGASTKTNGTKDTHSLSLSESALDRRAQEIVEAALDPMFQINETGRILMVNKAALTCFQYEREELMGNNISMICGGDHGRHHGSYLQKYLETGETQIIGKYRELPARRKDGSEFPIRLAVVELQTNGNDERLFCGFIHDLTKERRNEDIIFGTIDTSLDPVFHINEKGLIKNANMAAIEHLGWEWSELLGQNVSMVVGGGHAEHHDKYLQRYLETGKAKAIGKRRRLKARRRDGSEMPIELQLTEIKMHGGKERLFCAILTILPEE